jgi:hypothetical protein
MSLKEPPIPPFEELEDFDTLMGAFSCAIDKAMAIDSSASRHGWGAYRMTGYPQAQQSKGLVLIAAERGTWHAPRSALR